MVDDQHTVEENAYNAGYQDATWDIDAQVEDAYQEGYSDAYREIESDTHLEIQFDRLVEVLREEHYKHHNSHAMRFCENDICREATR